MNDRALKLLLARLLGVVVFNGAAFVYLPIDRPWWAPLAIGAACYMLADLWAVLTVGEQ